MGRILVDDEVYAELEKLRTKLDSFNIKQTFNNALRRLLKLPVKTK